MLGFRSPPILTTIRPFSVSRPLTFPCILFKTKLRNLESRSRFLFFASSGNKEDELTNQPEKKEQEQQQQQSNWFVNGDGGDDLRRDRRSIFNFKLGDLLDPDPENVVAIGLTGVLAWASVQILWQLFLISLTIVLAALKYSFIAALLLFILITLL